MRFEGAVIKEQGQTFAIVVVKRHVLQNRNEAGNTQHAFGRHFPGMPVVLIAQDARGVPSYFGRRDIVDFLAGVPMSAIPWSEYTVN
jgi:hypothetical protein